MTSISVGPRGHVSANCSKVINSRWWAFPVQMQAIIFANSLKEYEIIMLIYKIMQVRFIILLCSRGYNSLDDLIRQHDV